MATSITEEEELNPDEVIKPCEEYKAFWKSCSSWKSIFLDYYEYGERQDCSQFKIDYDNCLLWKTSQSPVAKEALLSSERKKQEEAKRYPPVWEMRTDPKKDWLLKYEDKEKPSTAS